MALRNRLWVVISAVLFLLAGAGAAYAQYTTGSVQGTVFDPSGAVVGNATVTLRNVKTGVARNFHTGSDGIYYFPAVQPGTYEVTGSASGFGGATVRFTASASQTVTQNLRLAVQSVATQVTVAETGAQVNTTDAQLSTTRDAISVNDLPNQGRNLVALATLDPGVTPMYSPVSGSLVKVSGAQTGQVAVNGGRPEASNVEFDFTDANDWEFGGFALGTQPQPDMVQEFKVLTSNIPAEYGVKSNGQIEMITKSGTNSWHGDAYDYIQNDWFNARDYFDKSGKATRIDENNYGFSMGGPVIKNKTFLFGGFEQNKTKGGGFTAVAAVPSTSARALVTDPTVASIFDQFIPQAAPSAGDPLVGTVTSQFSAPANNYQYLVRLDQHFSDKHSLAVRYFQGTGTFVLPFPSFNTLAGFDAGLHYEARNANITDTYDFSPATVNQLRVAYARSLGLLPPENNLQSPRFNILGLGGFGALPFFTQGRIFNVYQVNDIVSHMAGRHLLKFGFDARKIQDNSVNETNDRGVYTFSSETDFLNGQAASWVQAFGPTALGFRTALYAAFAQDDFRLRPDLTLNFGLRWEYQGELSEAHGGISVLDPALNQPIGVAGMGALGAFHVGNPAVHANPHNFGPRVGFAWNPGNGKFVARGGYGIYYNAFTFTGLSEARTNPPLNYTVALFGGQISGSNNFDNLVAGTAPIEVQTGAQLGSFGTLTNFGAITTVNPNLRNPYAQQWDLTLDYQLTPSTVISAAYVGSKGTHLALLLPVNPVVNGPAPATSLADELARLPEFQAAFAAENGPGNNRLDPRFNQVNVNTDLASSSFNSLQMEVRKSMSHGFQFQAQYTWSKSIDNSSSSNPTQDANDNGFPQNYGNLRAERAVSNYDIPQRFLLTGIWDLPFFKGRSGPLYDYVLKGWTFDMINQFQSGVPATILAGPVQGIPDVNMDGNFIPNGSDNARANCGPGPGFQLGNPASIAAQMKYSLPLLGNNGTCGRNTIRLNGIATSNWSITKHIPLKESGWLGSGPWDLQLRAEMYNVFNHPYLTVAGNAWRTLGSPAFGLYNSAGATRHMQMAIRLTW
jgi:hypothetical protein